MQDGELLLMNISNMFQCSTVTQLQVDRVSVSGAQYLPCTFMIRYFYHPSLNTKGDTSK